jgi:putative ABC transport system permease protein
VNELFGIPVETLLVVLLVALAAAAVVIGLLVLRNPVLARLGVRNVRRRGARTTLIVVGLMLGTTIVAAALTTGDTMSHTIRSSAVAQLGNTDEVVSAEGAIADIPGELGDATGTGYLEDPIVADVDRALAGTGLSDGVTPAIVELVALQAPASRQNEPRVTLFAADPARMHGFAPIQAVDGGPVALGDLEDGEIYLNEEAADELAAGKGDTVLVFAGGPGAPMHVRDVVRFDGAGTDGSAFLMPLAAAQQLLGKPGKVKHVLVSNTGGPTAGAALSDEVVTRLESALASSDVEVEPAKQDAIEQADEAGSAFMAFFTTFGSFSIAAGVLLIFLIFVMLAAERRGELGIARAIGTRRGHLVQMFTFEGAAYDLAAALVGALLGAAVAYGMVFVMAQAFATEGVDIEYAVTGGSLGIAYALGVLLTLVVVAFSAWRVSRMTISAAIRNTPEPPARGRRHWVPVALGLALGTLLILTSAHNATPLLLGISLLIVSVVPLARMAGVNDRLAFTVAGLALIVLWMMPWSWYDAIFGTVSMDFSTWIAAGLMVVIGAVWTIVYNADVLLGGTMRVLGRIGALAPLLRISMAYPLRSRFRTGTTLAMFTLVVFTLVTGTAASGSFVAYFQDEDLTGGGYQVRGATSPTAPVRDMHAALAETDGVDQADFASVGSQSVLAVDAVQTGTGREPENYGVRGLDPAFLEHTTFAIGSFARGYGSSREVWHAIDETPGLAVVDAFVVPRRDQFGFNALPSDFKLSGFYFEDGGFEPIPVVLTDPQTGRKTKVHVIGVLSDTAPLEMIGISTSQATLDVAFPGRTIPTIHYFETAPGVDADAAASELESAFLANGMEADSIHHVVEEATATSLTFNRLIQGFMALGLVVGIAALGVISARAVVERRQQIGVLRAIGFRRRMVEATFLLESSFVALTAIVVGTTLGLLLAWNIIVDSRSQPSWGNIELVVPWLNLFVIFAVVYGVALAATLAPALRASRIRPAEALRYE